MPVLIWVWISLYFHLIYIHTQLHFWHPLRTIFSTLHYKVNYPVENGTHAEVIYHRFIAKCFKPIHFHRLPQIIIHHYFFSFSLSSLGEIKLSKLWALLINLYRLNKKGASWQANSKWSLYFVYFVLSLQYFFLHTSTAKQTSTVRDKILTDETNLRGEILHDFPLRIGRLWDWISFQYSASLFLSLRKVAGNDIKFVNGVFKNLRGKLLVLKFSIPKTIGKSMWK